jgi:signal transduction histidine kinase
VSRAIDRFRQIDPRRLDRSIALVLSVMVIPFLFGEDVEGPIWANALVALAVTASLLARREHPVEVALATFGGSLVLTLLLTPSFLITPTTFAMMTASYSAGAHAEGSRAFAGLALAGGGIGVIAVLETPDDIIFPLLLFGAAPWLIGRTIRGQGRLARRLAEQEARVSHVRELEATSAIQRERNRVARELHDVLAHNLSVMVIQASAARRALERDPGSAVAAAQLIERTGREALVELRHVFGPVRRGEGEALEGSPGLARLEALIGRARAAGLPVEFAAEGDPLALSPGADIAAYRLVQEALTNTLKHAGRAATEVRVVNRPDGVAITISNEPPAGTASTAVDSGGHGLIGMRERMTLYGGEMDAGPTDDGGFAVRAELPAVTPAVAVS